MPATKMDDLAAELEGALMDAMQGDAWGATLAGRLERTARTILLRHGLGRARVRVSHQAGTVRVVVQLPPGPQRAARLVLSLRGA